MKSHIVLHHLGGSIVIGVTLYRWIVYFMENPVKIWIMTGGSPMTKRKPPHDDEASAEREPRRTGEALVAGEVPPSLGTYGGFRRVMGVPPVIIHLDWDFPLF